MLKNYKEFTIGTSYDFSYEVPFYPGKIFSYKGIFWGESSGYLYFKSIPENIFILVKINYLKTSKRIT